MEDEQLLDTALLAGKVLSLANAEASRIEDTMKRILTMSSLEYIEVLAQSTNLIVSSMTFTGERIVRMVRLEGHVLALDKIHQVNVISRSLCEMKISCSQAQAELLLLLMEEDMKISSSLLFGLWALGPSFALVFKGGAMEVVAVMILSVLYIGLYLIASKLNTLLFYLMASTLLAYASIALQLVASYNEVILQLDIVIISAIMPLVPGIAITNAIRDILHQDYVSGMSKLMESFAHACSVAFGIGFGYALGSIL